MSSKKLTGYKCEFLGGYNNNWQVIGACEASCLGSIPCAHTNRCCRLNGVGRLVFIQSNAGSSPVGTSNYPRSLKDRQTPSKRYHVGSNPTEGTNAGLAQLVERLFCNQDVCGSNP